ncbi:MAG: HAMP domain-containing sensor histidine kinase [Methylococcaceae bacterium]
MFARKVAGLNKKTFSRWLVLFFLALAIPTALLIQQSYSRLKWEVFHQHQLMADELVYRINQQFLQLIKTEEQRSFTDYSFLNVAGDPSANFFQRSPLSHYPVKARLPGVIGYFQVDSAGKLSTPLLPKVMSAAASYGISNDELAQRSSLHQQIKLILTQNNLVKNNKSRLNKDFENKNDRVTQVTANKSIGKELADAKQKIEESEEPVIQGQAAFDELKSISRSKLKSKNKLGRVEDLSFTQLYEKKENIKPQRKQQGRAAILAKKLAEKRMRLEKNVLPESIAAATQQVKDEKEQAIFESAKPVVQSDLASLRIRTFESEIDPFEFSQLESGHFVLFRKVWLDKQRYIQGVLIEQQAFLDQVINSAFAETALSQMSNLLVVYQGNVLKAYSGTVSLGYLSSHQELSGELLYQTRLSDPLSDIELLFSITQLPAGPGSSIIKWLALLMAFVLVGGFYLMYRLGVSQIKLANQQQDFVSAVSHELKTPLTSIRMYGEILREGWASNEKKQVYYDFICNESERLSRLINNVLDLAKMTRNEQRVVLKKITISELMDSVKSKVSSQVEQAGFELMMTYEDDIKRAVINVDEDWFAQIMINLVDNAIKFSAKSEKKQIELSCKTIRKGRIQFSVRDFGPGIDRQQMKKIFTLFYRTENELTRETVGTGIGLALVHQMVISMKGGIDVKNKKPGAEFRVMFLAAGNK